MNKLFKELKKIEFEIMSYAKYLKDYTYHPYDKVEEFSAKLRTLIEKYEK